MNPIGFYNNNNAVKKQEVQVPWSTEYSKQATIFGERTFLPIVTNRALNDNTLVVGTSGTGKTYSFVEPNILQGNCNYVIADAKGDILADTGASLKKMGYHLQVLNLVDLQHSMTYNPLDYMQKQEEVLSFANNVLKTEVNGRISNDSHQDPFWNKAASTLLEALIFFVQENLPKKEQTMATVVRLFDIFNSTLGKLDSILSSLGELETGYYFENYSENSDGSETLLGDIVFNWVKDNDPTSVAYAMWNKVRTMAVSEKTWASVTGILGSALAPYSISSVENLLSSSQIDFHQLLMPKNALFILYDDADASKNFISNTLYEQLFRFLYHTAFEFDDKKLPNKVRFFLDDFKNMEIPGFDDYLATARSRNISLCMMVQDESQLQEKFGVNTSSVIGNCSSYLLTGTTALNLAESASHRFDMTPKEIRLMDQDHFLLDVGGNITKPVRYDFHKHPNYVDKKTDIGEEFQVPIIDLAGDSWNGLRDVLKSLPGVNNRNKPTYIDISDDTLPF